MSKYDDYDYDYEPEPYFDSQDYIDYLDELDERATYNSHVDGYSEDTGYTSFKEEVIANLVEDIQEFLRVGTVSELLKIVAENT